MKTMFMFGCVAVVAGGACADTTLYSQGNDEPTISSFYSDAVAGQFFSQRMADNFSIGTAATVTGVKWWGGSQNYQYSDLSNMSDFIVEILADDGAGNPDGTNVLYSHLFTKAECNPTVTGASNFGGGIDYAYSATLTLPLNLQAGTQYWVSIGAKLVNPFADAWVWNHSTVGDGKNASNFFNGPNYFVFNSGDMAFEVVGSVPAPSALSAIGLGSLVALRRRR